MDDRMQKRVLIETRQTISDLSYGKEVPVKITTFFDNRNFLLTKYKPLTTAVDTIVEFESGLEWHVEYANCGFEGNGPGRTEDLYNALEIDCDYAFRSINNNDAVLISFGRFGWEIDYLNEFVVFAPDIRNYIATDRISEKINYDVDLLGKTIRLYNPQRNETSGFFRLINRVKPFAVEFYYGPDSPLDGYMRVEKQANNGWYGKRDDSGTKQVNVTIFGEYATIHCFIDERDCIGTMNFISVALTGQPLVKERFFFSFKKEIYEVREILHNV